MWQCYVTTIWWLNTIFLFLSPIIFNYWFTLHVDYWFLCLLYWLDLFFLDLRFQPQDGATVHVVLMMWQLAGNLALLLMQRTFSTLYSARKPESLKIFLSQRGFVFVTLTHSFVSADQWHWHNWTWSISDKWGKWAFPPRAASCWFPRPRHCAHIRMSALIFQSNLLNSVQR